MEIFIRRKKDQVVIVFHKPTVTENVVMPADLYDIFVQYVLDLAMPKPNSREQVQDLLLVKGEKK